MNESIAITGVISGYRTTADGTLKVTVELDELQTAKFHEGFGHGVFVAVARLEEQPKGE